MQQTKAEEQSTIMTQFTSDGISGVASNKIKWLIQTLNQDTIDLKKLKAFLGQGIPDEAVKIRQYSWKLALGYLPQQKSKWLEKSKQQQKTYKQFITMFLPDDKFPDYPIQLNKNHERFKQLEQQFYLWEQIQKDTSRTHAELSFFCVPANPIMIPFLTSPRREKFKIVYGDNEEAYKGFLKDKEIQRKTYRYDYMTRILYIYAKLNPKIQYVQGMNQILAPIFYIVNAGKKPTQPIEEASCFFMFNNAIADIIQLHIKDLDKSQNGIYGKLNEVNEMLVVIEPKIWQRLQQLKIDPFFYCFRWMTLLFAQDFQLFDTMRIWQSIFSAQNRLDFMNYFAIAMILSARSYILDNDFTMVLEHLQNISESINIYQTIKTANELYYQFKDHDFKEQAKITKKALKQNGTKTKKNWMNNLMNKIDKML